MTESMRNDYKIIRERLLYQLSPRKCINFLVKYKPSRAPKPDVRRDYTVGIKKNCLKFRQVCEV